jgi:exopolyphosphatase / guanosine-5'-triphosphate,3'-diphosphate pyrophosphatase
VKRVAAIDIGTNSIHMIVAEMLDDGYRVIDREKDSIQLGLDSLDGAPLTAGAIRRGVASLERMRQIAEGWDTDEIIAVATSAVREAPNQSEFLRSVRARAGINVRVISGEEEARLIYRAVRASVELEEKTALCVDVGGGSVEIIVGTGEHLHFARSEPLGALRLAQRYDLLDFADAENVDGCRAFVRKKLRRSEKSVRALDADVCVATSGTALALVSLARAGRRATARGLRRLRRADVANAVGTLTGTNREERVEQFGFDRKRAQTIVAGAVVIDEVMDVFDIESLIVCPAAIREGILESLMSGTRDSVRRASVLALARRMHCDMRHGNHVAELAGCLFDGLADEFALRHAGREILEYASLLHETGMHISERGHDRHTDYIVRHGDLKGFTEEQIATIASLARFYRINPPEDWREAAPELNAKQRLEAQKLTAILRVADGLDRGHRQRVRAIRVSADDGEVAIELHTRGDASVEIESAKKRAKYFREIFGTKLLLR